MSENQDLHLVRCSHNELHAVIEKAALGFGFDVGVARDVADAGTWLTGASVDPTAAILGALRLGPSPTAPTITWPGNTSSDRTSRDDADVGDGVRIVGVCVASHGGGLLDLLADLEDDHRLHVTVARGSLLVLLGLMGSRSQQRGHSFELELPGDDSTMRIDPGTQRRGIAAERAFLNRSGLDVGSVDGGILIRRRRPHEGAGSPTLSESITPVSMPQSSLHDLERAAARTWVPASDISRRGAGAAIDDND